MIIMESELPSTSNSQSTPLFPAYSSIAQNQEDRKDWLCNSSFIKSSLKEAHSQLLNQQSATTASENTPSQSVKKKPLDDAAGKKKLHKRTKHEKYLDASLSVLESESVIQQLKKKTFIEETGLSFERAFQTDATRDVENLMFESFERTKIASYKTFLHTPVGLSPTESSWWSVFLPKRKEKVPARYFHKTFVKVMKIAPSETIRSDSRAVQCPCLNFLPISTSSNFFTYSDAKAESAPDFFNVSSSWRLEKHSNDKAVPEDKSSTESFGDELKGKVIHYNKTLSDDPGNVELWIAFVNFQDKIGMMTNEDKSQIFSEKSITEKKIAILEKALKYNPKNVRLNVLKLRLSQNLYGADQLTSMWENLVFFNPNSHKVWREYLLYSLSNLTTFNISNIMKLYSRCLRTLSNIYERITESHEPCQDIVPNMLRIFDQLCRILRSCGFTEKAIAAYQAQVEFNLFCESSSENLSVEEKVSCFEPFWDSGAQRVGENDALGWAITVQQKKVSYNHISTDSDLNNMEDEILAKKLSLSETWLQFESLREKHHWLPWKPNPEYDQTGDDIDDLDRSVSFDDVSKFLFRVHTEEHKFLLLMHFVKFLGFDPHFLGCQRTEKATFNPYSLENYDKISSALRQSQIIHPLADPFPAVTQWSEEKFNFVDNIFSLSVNTFSLRYKALCTFMWVKFRKHYVLQVSGERNHKDLTRLKKFIKGILKKSENRNCLLLWFEYISTEWWTDKLSAVETFRSLFLSGTCAASSKSMQSRDLWYFMQAFIKFLLYDQQNLSSDISSYSEMMWMLSHVANKEKYTLYTDQAIKPAMVLRTVSAFKSALEEELAILENGVESSLCSCLDPQLYSVLNCANCFAFFEYFTQDCEAAVQVYQNLVSSITSRVRGHCGKYILEQITVAEATLLNFHTWNSTVSIKPLRIFLCSSVKKFPHNCQLLYLLINLRRASSVISPTRRFLTEVLKNYKSHPVTWLFALIAEFTIYRSLLLQHVAGEESLKESVSNLGINWRIRSLYEKMFQCDVSVCCHISTLWRSYLKFEIMTMNTERAKSVFHRSLQYCGWSKALLMDAIEYFPDELNEILAFMGEKQIRLHTPLEEVALLMEHAATDS